MAKLDDIPAEHRSTASRMKHLESMPTEEARHRAAHVARLEEKMPLTGEGRDLMSAHAEHILRSLPVREYLAKLKHYHDTANAMPGGTVDSPAHELLRAAAKLKGENQYPPGLLHACEERLLGHDPMYDECDIDAVLGIGQAHQAKADTPKRKVASESYREEVTKSIAEAKARLDGRLESLRKELDAATARIAAEYARHNMPIPKHLGVTLDQHPDMPRVRELEKEAQEYRDKADGTSEGDLSMYYVEKARVCEQRAADLKKAAEAST